MNINTNYLVYLVIGILLITLLNTAGAVASRKLRFNYGLLSPLSFAIYTLISFLISKEKPMDVAIACNVLIGMFDAIAGWNLLTRLKANTGKTEEQLVVMNEKQRIILMIVIAGFFGVVGYMLAHNITM